MTDSPTPIDDRAANIKEVVSHIVHRKTEDMFNEFDRLHRRNIHDNDVVEALRDLHEIDLLDAYAEWADIDIREDDNTTLSDIVPDPAASPSYATHPLNAPAIHKTGSVAFGGIGFEYGRDTQNRQHIRPIGGVWVLVVEDSK